MTSTEISHADVSYAMPSATLGGMATTTASLNFDSYLPEGQHLLDFQHVGVAYAIWQTQDGKGSFIADEQGLGKTAQAITTVKVHAAAHSIAQSKTLIVCKASLKGNWEKEIRRFAPEWDVQVLSGTRPYEMLGNVAIISFNLLSKWANALIAEGFTSLVIDESHVVKDPKTQQTKAAIKIAADVRSRKGLTLLLSGTPLLNRPVELVSQLQIMGRLEDVTPAPRAANPTDRDWEYAFKFSYCGAEKNSYGKWEFKGGSRLDLLNTKLRNECLIRRLRKDVLSMSETTRIRTDLSLNGDLNRYKAILSNFVAKDPRSFKLELLTALRQEVALAKIPHAIEWILDFVEENPGKKLVAWGWHVETQQALTAALNEAGIKAIYLKGEQDKGRIEAAKAEFNEGDAQVIVCSLQAHREGHTLLGDGTNVTDSLFVELPWHPGAVSQAQDRISRIGRKADAVVATRLIVPNTTDEWLDELIEGKWVTFKAAADGTIAEWEQQDIQKAMMDRLAAELRAMGRSFPGDDEGVVA